jgi:hypothetical protein
LSGGVLDPFAKLDFVIVHTESYEFVLGAAGMPRNSLFRRLPGRSIDDKLNGGELPALYWIVAVPDTDDAVSV